MHVSFWIHLVCLAVLCVVGYALQDAYLTYTPNDRRKAVLSLLATILVIFEGRTLQTPLSNTLMQQYFISSVIAVIALWCGSLWRNREYPSQEDICRLAAACASTCFKRRNEVINEAELTFMFSNYLGSLCCDAYDDEEQYYVLQDICFFLMNKFKLSYDEAVSLICETSLRPIARDTFKEYQPVPA